MGAKVAADSLLLTSPDIVQYNDSGAAAFLWECSSQIVEMNYTLSGGTKIDLVVSNATERAVQAITDPLLFPASQAWDSVIVGVRQAGLESTIDGPTATFAKAYSHMVLSIGVGGVVPYLSLQESTQTIRQIARMPKASFTTLIVLNCLYVLMGSILAVIALASRPRVVKPVQARLSVIGLVAAAFEGARAEEKVTKMSHLFEEKVVDNIDNSRKIVLKPTAQGGWRFRKT